MPPVTAPAQARPGLGNPENEAGAVGDLNQTASDAMVVSG